MNHLTMPLSQFLDELGRQELVVGFFLLGTGLVFMLLGLRIFRPLVAISFAIVGFVLGGSLTDDEVNRILFAFAGAIGLGLLSVFAMRLSVAGLAGGWAALAMVGMATHWFGADGRATLVVGGIAFVVAVSLAFILYDEMLALITSLEGCLLFLAGLVVFLNQSPVVWSHLRGLLLDNMLFAPFLVMSGTLTGFFLQLAELRHRKSGLSG